MKYKVVKPITLQGVYNVGDKSCFAFMEMFDDMLRWCFFKWGMTTQFFAVIDFNVLEAELDKHPKCRDFLLGGCFIEKVEEVFYSVGDRFRHSSGNEFLLAHVGSGGLVQLIRANGRGFYSQSNVHVEDVYKITKEEFAKVVYNNSEYFTKIEEGK